jgi:tRNA U34 5-carboxymethylaminomethyl modifying enzyme MnmG/GidA
VAGRVEVTQGLSADLHVLGARFENLKEGAPARVASKGANNDVPAAQAAPASSKKAS